MVEGRDVAIGLALGSAVAFLHAVWPAIVDPDVREPIRYDAGEQTDLDAFVSSCIAFGAMGLVIDMTGKLVANPESWKEML